MIQVNLRKLVSRLAYESNQPQLSVQYLSAKSKVHRHTITRLLESPEAGCRTKIVGNLLSVLFEEFRKVTSPSVTDQELLDQLLREFITASLPAQKRRPGRPRKET